MRTTPKDRRQSRGSLTLYWSLLAGHRKAAVASIVVASFSGLAEAVGLVSILPLLQQADPGVAAALPVLALLAGFLILSTALKYLVDYLVSKVTIAVELEARAEMIGRLVDAPWSKVARFSQGEITAAVMSESTQLSNGVLALLTGLSTTVVVVVLVVVAGALTAALLAMTLVFIVLTVVIYRVRLRRVRENEHRFSTKTTDIGEDISSALGDLKFMRESGSDELWRQQTEGNARELAALRSRQILYPSLTRTVVEALGGVFLASIVLVSLALGNSLALGLVFIALFYRIIPRVQVAQTSLNTAFTQSVWIERWNARLQGVAPEGERALAAVEPPAEAFDQSALELRDVSFTYPGRDVPVLSDFNFAVQKGERVAVFGPSGSGKTTVLDLALGLFTPDRGAVLVDGRQPKRDDWKDIRQRLGVIPQEVPMKRGTLAQNIIWDSPFDVNRLARSIKDSSLDSLIVGLPQGVDTFVDSRTIGLSGGQRQRIGIARALYRSPELLIMDEATSALDGASEKAVLDTLAALPRSITMVMISHREAVRSICDRVVDLGVRVP